MGNRMGTVAEDYKEEYPGLPTYLQCQSNAFVSGTVALFMAGTGTYFAQGRMMLLYVSTRARGC